MAHDGDLGLEQCSHGAQSPPSALELDGARAAFLDEAARVPDCVLGRHVVGQPRHVADDEGRRLGPTHAVEVVDDVLDSHLEAIQQGPATENPTIVSYGAEGLQHPLNELYFVNNTVVNDRPAGARFLFVRAGTGAVHIVNNVFSGRGAVLSGPGELRDNVAAPKSHFADSAGFDYRLKPGAAAIGRGVDPGSAHGFELRPTAQYAHKAGKKPRGNSGKLDLGAFEYRPWSSSNP